MALDVVRDGAHIRGERGLPRGCRARGFLVATLLRGQLVRKTRLLGFAGLFCGSFSRDALALLLLSALLLDALLLGLFPGEPLLLAALFFGLLGRDALLLAALVFRLLLRDSLLLENPLPLGFLIAGALRFEVALALHSGDPLALAFGCRFLLRTRSVFLLLDLRVERLRVDDLGLNGGDRRRLAAPPWHVDAHDERRHERDVQGNRKYDPAVTLAMV
jgi:hypothetical protein